jgi:hypothetical protein
MRTTDGRTAEDEWNPVAQVLQISIAVLEIEWMEGASLGNTRETASETKEGTGLVSLPKVPRRLGLGWEDRGLREARPTGPQLPKKPRSNQPYIKRETGENKRQNYTIYLISKLQSSAKKESLSDLGIISSLDEGSCVRDAERFNPPAI